MVREQTIRLRFIKSADDARLLLATAAHREVYETLGLEIANEKKFVNECLQRLKLGTQFTFAIVHKKMIGGVWLQMLEDRRQARLVYWIGREFWGRGYATESVRQIIRVAHDDLKIKRLTALIEPANSRSKRVAVKCGFEAQSQTAHWNVIERREEKLDIFSREITE